MQGNKTFNKLIVNALWVFVFSISFFSTLRAQDTIVLRHRFYTSIFVKSRHIPCLVEFSLSREMLSCGEHIKRSNKFTPDPELFNDSRLNLDYRHSGYDRGHNMSAQDNECESEGMKECFYFTNLFPQTHSLNAGAWENLEKHERKEALSEGKIKVFIGSLGEIARIGPDRVVVPEFCWKVIYNESKKSYECFLMPNKELEDQDYLNYKVSLKEIESKSGILFKADQALVPGRFRK